MYNNQCHGEESFLRGQQFLSYSFNWLLHNTWDHSHFHHSLTHTLSHNFFCPPIFCSHIYSSLNNFAITAHMFSANEVSCCHTKRDIKSETRTNNRNPWPNLPFIKWNKWHTMKLKPQTSPTILYTTYLNWNNQTKHFFVDDKHNSHGKLPVRNCHNQNTNITTA